MSDSPTIARTARMRVGQALAALQDPTVPPQALAVAEPLAHAMRLLHRVEASPGEDLREVTVEAHLVVRRVLSVLQAEAAWHPAVADCMEGVAEALGLAHQLTVQPLARPAFPHGTFITGSPLAAPEGPPGHGPAPVAPIEPPRGYEPASYPSAAVFGSPAPPPYRPAAPALFGSPPAAPELAGPTRAAYSGPDPFGPRPDAHRSRAAAPQPGASGPAAPHRPPAAPEPAPNSDLARVVAELGAHSPTNFYKDLSGHDVIEAGGVFIATYKTIAIGQQVLIEFSMPGGYEFRARGVVRFTREGSNAPEAPPGIGVRITEIPTEGRHLVGRYVKNREPLFFDL